MSRILPLNISRHTTFHRKGRPFLAFHSTESGPVFGSSCEANMVTEEAHLSSLVGRDKILYVESWVARWRNKFFFAKMYYSILSCMF